MKVFTLNFIAANIEVGPAIALSLDLPRALYVHVVHTLGQNWHVEFVSIAVRDNRIALLLMPLNAVLDKVSVLNAHEHIILGNEIVVSEGSKEST